MKEIETNEIDKLLQIITPAPLLRIGHFSDQGTVLPRRLDAFCATHAYDYLLNCTTEAYHKEILQLGDKQVFSDTTAIRYFSLERPNYMQHGKFYDYLFVAARLKVNLYKAVDHKHYIRGECALLKKRLALQIIELYLFVINELHLIRKQMLKAF